MPETIQLEYLRKQAKALLKSCRNADSAALARVRSGLPRLASLDSTQIAEQVRLADMHQLLAREKGYANWGELKRHDAPLERFLTSVRGGDLKAARAELQQWPAITEESIHAACSIGHIDIVRQFIDVDAQLVDAEEAGWTALTYACASPFHQLSHRHAAGIAECVTLLLDRGVDPNAQSAMRRSLLAGNRSAALVLYQRNGDATQVSEGKQIAFKQAFWGIPADQTAFDRALADLFQDSALVAELNRRMREEVEKRLGRWISKKPGDLSPEDVYAPIYPLNQHFNVMIWEFLIKRGVQPNWHDRTHDSLLHHLAMWSDDPAHAELFLSNGADPNLPRADGVTPYFLAVRYGNKPVADVLRAHGARQDGVRLTDELIGACRRLGVREASSLVRRHPEVLRHLEPADTEVLIESAASNQLDVVRLMLEIGFNPADIGESGHTALHAAAWHGHVDMVRLLLKYGAPLHARDTMFAGTPHEWALHGSKHCRDADRYPAVLELLAIPRN